MHSLGGTYADADKALEGFSMAFGAPQAGLSAEAVKPFTALGLDPKSFKTTEEALEAVTRKISALGSKAQPAAIADKLGLSDMLPALREGTDRIADLRKNLKRSRKAVGWSQERLAQEAALESKGYISAREGGKRPMPPGRTLEALARAFGVETATSLRSRPNTLRPFLS